MRAVTPLLLLLAACDRGSIELPVPELTLEVDQPVYGAFVGDGPILVEGRVSDPSAEVWIEGYPIPVHDDGSFLVEVPIDHAYRIVDVDARLVNQIAGVRVPVFSGHDPMLTWPGGISARLTEVGLDHLAEGLGAAIDDLGWDQQILDAIPSIDSGGFTVAATDVTHEPTTVTLVPDVDGIAFEARIEDLVLEFETGFEIFGAPFQIPATVGIGLVSLNARVLPGADDDGALFVSLEDLSLDLADTQITLLGFDLGLVEGLVDLLLGLVDGAADTLLQSLVSGIDGMSLGGPLSFEMDLLGTPLQVRLSDLYTDPEGMGLELGMGLGAPVSDAPLGLPNPVPNGRYGRPDAVLNVHEGAIQPLLTSDMLDLLSQDLELDGLFGNVLGIAIKAIPGGDQAPDEVSGWCVGIELGEARVARLQPDLDRFAMLYFPDARVDIGVKEDSSFCKTWLDASIALEVGIGLDGTALALDLAVGDGAVLEYGAEGVEEREVIDGLGTFVGSILDLAGGFLNLDLADLLGGTDLLGGLDIPGLGAIEPKLLESTQVVDAQGEPVEGMYALSIQIWE